MPAASDLGQPSLTLWGLSVSTISQDGDSLLHPQVQGPAHPRRAITALGSVGGNRGHRAVRCCPVSQLMEAERSGVPGLPPPSPRALLLLIHEAAAPLPFRPKVPGDSTRQQPGQGLGPGERQRLCHSAFHASAAPQPPEALSALDPPFSGPKPLRISQPVLEVGPPALRASGPVIRNGWGRLAREGRKPGAETGEERGGLTTSELPHLPSSRTSLLEPKRGAQGLAQSSLRGGLQKGLCTPQR